MLRKKTEGKDPAVERGAFSGVLALQVNPGRGIHEVT